MLLPWYWEILLMIGAIGCSALHYRRRAIFGVLVWANLALYYLLVHLDVLGADTRHLYGRINTGLIMLAELTPYILGRLQTLMSKYAAK